MKKSSNFVFAACRKWVSSTSSMLISWTWRRPPQSTWWGTSTFPTRTAGSAWDVLASRAMPTPFRSLNSLVNGHLYSTLQQLSHSLLNHGCPIYCQLSWRHFLTVYSICNRWSEGQSSVCWAVLSPTWCTDLGKGHQTFYPHCCRMNSLTYFSLSHTGWTHQQFGHWVNWCLIRSH